MQQTTIGAYFRCSPHALPPANRGSDVAARFLLHFGQREGGDDRGLGRGNRTCKLPQRAGRTARGARPSVRAGTARGRISVPTSFAGPTRDTGGITAIDKVGSFLLSLAGRASETKGQVELPVSRYDIADYLAVSVETVCRSITDLQHRGVITLAGKRTLKILNRSALEDRSGENSMVARPSRMAA
jgi:Crp-like helix-turn-helix domain